MADTPTILGQIYPAATTETDLYVPSASTTGIISAIHICNEGVTARTFRLGVDADGGAAVATDEWLAYDHPIGGNSFMVMGRGLIIPNPATLVAYSSFQAVSFQAFGVERV